MELRAAREASGKTQKQVAKEAGVTERTYLYYEIDNMEPGAKTAIRIADVLGIKSYKAFKEIFGVATPDETRESEVK